MPDIRSAYEEVKGRVAAAARRAGRDPGRITIVVVTKTRSPEEVAQVIAAGAQDLGENYVQELGEKRRELAARGLADLRWHFIGTLQRNKAKYLAPFCHLIHSLDSQKLAQEVNRRAAEYARSQPVLIEVNVSGEESKSGLRPEETAALAEHVASLEHLSLRGLMTMTPYGVEADQARRLFASLRELAARLAPSLPPGAMDELSMGMTQDYELAIEEGATLVRVGTAIFGPRSPI